MVEQVHFLASRALNLAFHFPKWIHTARQGKFPSVFHSLFREEIAQYRKIVIHLWRRFYRAPASKDMFIPLDEQYMNFPHPRVNIRRKLPEWNSLNHTRIFMELFAHDANVVLRIIWDYGNKDMRTWIIYDCCSGRKLYRIHCERNPTNN